MKNLDYVTLILTHDQSAGINVPINLGGVFRPIDFALSNCKYSRADIVGIVTRNRRGDFTGYTGCGSLWRGENERARVTVLSPRVRGGVREVYKDQTDAIRKNFDFIERYNPANVLVLSGEGIYKMNYRKILMTHEYTGAAATVAAVPFYEAPRFGTVNTDKNGIITNLDDGLNASGNALASMGVYIFNRKILKKYLFDQKTRVCTGDGILKQMLKGGHKLNAYRFGGYWKDIDNIYSFWEANMELLSTPPSINLHDREWSILDPDNAAAPHLTQIHSSEGRAQNSFVARDCLNKGTIKRSIISSGVEINDNATIMDSVIMPGAKIGENAFVLKAVVGAGAVVGHNTVLYCVQPDGKHIDNCYGISVIGNNVKVNCAGRPQEL